MKKIVKKNQIIITSLAILIAVAGYLNYSERSVLEQTGKEENEAEVVNDVIKNEENISKETTELSSDYTYKSDENTEETLDNLVENGEEISESKEPGEAILTNVGTFSANAKLQREQLRAKNKELLLEMINNQNLTESQKSDITQEMIHMTQTSELENEVETLLEAKGFEGVVVSINEDSVDVVVSMIDVNDKQRAQIEDIVKRKTNVEISNIIITPISIEN